MRRVLGDLDHADIAQFRAAVSLSGIRVDIRRQFGKVGVTALVHELAHVGGKRGLIVLQPDYVIGLLLADLGHNRLLHAHRVDRDDDPFSDNNSSSAWIAVISFDFSSTVTCLRVSPASVPTR